MKISRKILIISMLLIVVLGALVYANAIGGEFLWDDNDLVKNNVYIKSADHFGKIFMGYISTEVNLKRNTFYRPIQMFSYYIDYKIWGLNPKGYHLTSIVLHVLVALTLFWMLNLMFKDFFVSFFSSILFVVHPIHTEAITYISGRSDPIAALFMLGTIVFYIKGISENKKRYMPLLILSYVIALLSREASLCVVPLIILYNSISNRKWRNKWFLSVLGSTVVYALARLLILAKFSANPSIPSTIFQRMPGFFAAMFEYVKLLILPFNLHMEYGFKFFSYFSPIVIIGFLITMFMTAYVFFERKNKGIVFFSILWFFITILPVSNIYPVNAYMAEHWLYLPSIGFFILMGYGISLLYKRKNIRYLAIVIFSGLTVFYSYLSIAQNSYWQKSIPFFERTAKYAKDSARVHFNLGNRYKAVDRNEDAMRLYKKALEIEPEFGLAYNNMGLVLVDRGKSKEAIKLYKKAIQIDPVHAEAYNNMGVAYRKLKHRKEAINSYVKAIHLNPKYAEAYSNLGGIYADMRKYDKAIPMYKKAIESDPYYPEIYYNLGCTYDSMGMSKEAVGAYKKAVEIKATYVEALHNLGSAYAAMGKNKKAIYYYKKAVELDPSYISAYSNLSVMYCREGEFDSAIKYCDLAAKSGYKIQPELLQLLKPYRKGQEEVSEQ